MTGKRAVLLLTALLASTSGCRCGPTASTVPWWKGLPSMVIAPSSIEAEAWRRRCHAAHPRPRTPYMSTGDCACIHEEFLSPEAENPEPELAELGNVPLDGREPQGLERVPREGDVFVELPDGSLQLMPLDP
jgi:hypothetical protein